MIDAVLSYHLNPFTCGVAKFNQQLAKRLGVPCLGLGSHCRHPLVSIKGSELEDDAILLADPGDGSNAPLVFDLFLHDRDPRSAKWASGARRVFYADEIGIPSLLEGNPSRGSLNVLLFGMSHKVERHIDYLERLRDLLPKAHSGYTVSVSTGVHEGSPWDGAFTATVDSLRAIFGDHLRVLGYLADDALARELQDCSACALFYEPAVRANNTTIWAALQASCPVITNLDECSPAELIHDQTVLDIKRLTAWPMSGHRTNVARAGQRAGQARSWDALVEVLR